MRQGEAGREVLRQAVGDGEYFVALLPDGSRLVHAITRGDKHPLNFGREVCPTLPTPLAVLCARVVKQRGSSFPCF